MNTNDPTTMDDKKSPEERYEDDLKMRERGIRPGELSPEERDDIVNDLHSDQDNNSETDDDDRLSDVVPEEENDGND